VSPTKTVRKPRKRNVSAGEVPSPSAAAVKRLEREPNLWLATVRRSGEPHLVPVWFVYEAGRLHVCTDPKSVKVRNIRARSSVVVALEGGDRPVIAYGKAQLLSRPWPPGVVADFKRKYDWDIEKGSTYSSLLTIEPSRWIEW
jgi:F420H(2)-dependent biliverdin reductase